MPRGHDLAERELVGGCVCVDSLQRRLHRPGRRVYPLRRWQVQNRDGQRGVHELPRRDVLGRDQREQRERLHELPRWGVFTGGGERVYHLFSRDVFTDGDERVYRLFSRDVFTDGDERVYRLFSRDVFTGGDERLHGLPDQLVFRGVCGLVRAVPDERAVGGGECLAGVLLLQDRICACGGLVHLPDL